MVVYTLGKLTQFDDVKHAHRDQERSLIRKVDPRKYERESHIQRSIYDAEHKPNDEENKPSAVHADFPQDDIVDAAGGTNEPDTVWHRIVGSDS